MADTDLGTDINLVTDLAPVFGVASGFANLAAALARRLDTERGALFYDPDYGLDLKAYLNQQMSDAEMSELQGAIVAELQKDPRVSSASAEVTRGSLDCALAIETDDGPFDLVLHPSDLTVEILKVGVGGEPAAPAPAPIVMRVKGDKGDPGIQGPEGAGGGGGSGVTLDDTSLNASNLGTEEVIFEWAGIDFSALSASLTARLSAEVLSAAGTATFKLRVGGTSGGVDGAVAVTITTGSPSFTRQSASASISGLTGVLFVKVTATSSGAAVDAQARAPVVTFR